VKILCGITLAVETWENAIIFAGRILFVGIFLASGLGAHFAKAKIMASAAASKGVPWALPSVLATGSMIVAGGLSILLGVWIDLGALLLVAFLIPTALIMHSFWRESDPMQMQMEQVQFLKDLALAGAALMLFVFFVHVGDDLGWTLTSPLFSF
jgi:putative oxidoreductase